MSSIDEHRYPIAQDFPDDPDIVYTDPDGTVYRLSDRNVTLEDIAAEQARRQLELDRIDDEVDKSGGRLKHEEAAERLGLLGTWLGWFNDSSG